VVLETGFWPVLAAIEFGRPWPSGVIVQVGMPVSREFSVFNNPLAQ
jgi:hypothetical protein